MLRKILTSCIAVSICAIAYSQDSANTPAFKLSGSADGYYRYNFSGPPAGNTNNFTSFTNSQNSFELGMASLKAEHNLGKASVTADLGFGRRAEEFSYADTNHSTLFAVKQLFVTYAITDKIKLTAGKWATHIGYELVDAYANRNYSMSYMFSYGPFSHTGLKADIGLGGKSAFMVGIANPTDHVTTTSSTKVGLAQFSTGSSNDKFKAYLNYQGFFGSGSLNQFDLVLTGTISEKFGIGYNGTVQSQKPKNGSSNSWWGSALYLNLDPTSVFGLTLRGEYFNNKKNLLSIGGIGSNIVAGTLSANFKVGNLRIIPEFRVDHSNESIFVKSNGSGNQTTATGLLAATYFF